MTNKITIDKEEYISLLIAQEVLYRLEAGGVDNWGWYNDALNPDGEESLDEARDRIREEVMGHEETDSK